MTQPERSEVDWALLFAVDCALRQLELALPPWVRITLEVDTNGPEPLTLEYSSSTPEEDLLQFIREAAPVNRELTQTRDTPTLFDHPPEAS